MFNLVKKNGRAKTVDELGMGGLSLDLCSLEYVCDIPSGCLLQNTIPRWPF